MKRNVTIHLTPNDNGSYMVTGSVAEKSGGGRLSARTFRNDQALRDFLADDLGIREEVVKEAIEALRVTPSGKRTRSIWEVWLTDEEIRRHGLGPV